jgi:hypothetical protein
MWVGEEVTYSVVKKAETKGVAEREVEQGSTALN